MNFPEKVTGSTVQQFDSTDQGYTKERLLTSEESTPSVVSADKRNQDDTIGSPPAGGLTKNQHGSSNTRRDSGDRPGHSSALKFMCNQVSLGRSRTNGTEKDFDVLYTASSRSRSSLGFEIWTPARQFLQIQFAHYYDARRHDVFGLRIYLSDLCGPIEIQDVGENLRAVTFSSGVPPKIYKRQMTTVFRSSNGQLQNLWIRLPEISATGRDEDLSKHQIHIYQEGALFEAGRCNTFHCQLSRDVDFDRSFASVLEQLKNLNTRYTSPTCPTKFHKIPAYLYKGLWFDYYKLDVRLPFETRYLIDSALSFDCLDETEIKDVIDLFETIPVDAVHDLLLQVIFNGQRLGGARDHLEKLYLRGSLRSKQVDRIPEYCVKLHKVVITSTASKSTDFISNSRSVD